VGLKKLKSIDKKSEKQIQGFHFLKKEREKFLNQKEENLLGILVKYMTKLFVLTVE
jgi:hypothetical protein